ncbi:porin family protein [Aureicoccus marinus]|jgi:hypothetical protein|uniref:Outer membrane protein beta-barrel domain-containing protein n=1 Tax=Aureicoccus marinus TaxID=754435 RepID=A0A2S7T7G3_9FLAO|nr:hypothetical protein [Aureicoccus marinus]PQJ15457.1 hypothetical protein BST99_06645 [Aureicoccus marinus]
MKKNALLIVALFCGLLTFGQNEKQIDVFTDLYEDGSKLSFKAGYLSLSQTLEDSGNSMSDSKSGYYAGIAFNFGVSPKFDFQTELVYANSSEQSDALHFPFLASFHLSENLALQLGPQFVFALQRQPDNIAGFQFNFGFGARYDIGKGAYIDARYAPQLSNSYRGEQDITLQTNILTLGLGFTVN